MYWGAGVNGSCGAGVARTMRNGLSRSWETFAYTIVLCLFYVIGIEDLPLNTKK